jgi:subtilase family serine protease
VKKLPPMKLGMACLAAAAIAAAGAGAVSPANAVGVRITPHRIQVNPPDHQVSINPSKVTFSCQSRPLNGTQGPRCYQPSQIQRAYSITPLLNRGKDGRGRTIVIVDAFDSPYVANDLRIFDKTFDLKNPPSFTKIAPKGVPKFDVNDPNQVGWAEETTLDVLWAHAVAPGAKIKLVQAKSNQDVDILAATQYAIDHNLGDVLSQSFGEAEQCLDPQLAKAQHAMFVKAKNQHWSVFASSGDSGAAQPACDATSDAALLSASTPASDPLVTGVGGTSLLANAVTGAYVRETAWTEPFGCNPPAVAPTDVNCSGGGFSILFKKPDFQDGLVPGNRRGVPDVSYDAGVSGGVLTHCGICNVEFGLDPGDPTVFFIFGGTSAGTPQWAGLATIADQLAGKRLGDLNPRLYSLARNKWSYSHDFHDVKAGNNDVAELDGFGYHASPGWDPVTGLGTPKAANLLPALAHRG